MAEAEGVVRRQEQLNAEITERIARMIAEQELNMDYLLRFGVTAAERTNFREILEDVSRNGGLSLEEAANLAHAQGLARAAD